MLKDTSNQMHYCTGRRYSDVVKDFTVTLTMPQKLMIMFIQSCLYLIQKWSSNVNLASFKSHLSLLAMMPKTERKRGIATISLMQCQCQLKSKYFCMLIKENMWRNITRIPRYTHIRSSCLFIRGC